MKIATLIALLGAGFAAPVVACSSCGCALTSDWLNQGLVSQPGTTFMLRYDYVPQTQLRSGTARVSDVSLPADREIERYTYNHYVTAAIDHQFSSDWGLNLQLPFVYRPHATIGEGEVDRSFSRTGGLGDVRITARWQGLSRPGAINGIQFGLALPTGRIHERFRSGSAAGEEVDRGLQPGFGVIQAAAGFYRYGRLTPNVDYIVQLEGQAPLNRRDLFKPGVSGQASAGLQLTHWRAITPQMQFTLRGAAKDRGANSDSDNSGGVQIYATPGLTAGLGGGVSAFGHVQLPLYQHVNGYQLTPRATLSIGLQYRL